eukprot:m.59165 g.59165  ORF g.59165 m.59165 type:complete len:233 (-) comp12951_c1_seq2:67-765(-)
MASRKDNILLQKPKLGKAQKPMNKAASGMTHGRVSAKSDSAADCLTIRETAGPGISTTSTLLHKAELGRARPGVVPNAEGKTHGKTITKKPTDSASHQMQWGSNTNTPNSAKNPVGRSGRSQAEKVAMTHGVPNVTRDGGTAEALSDWRPDTPKSKSGVHYKIDNSRAFGVASHKDIGVGELLATSQPFADSAASTPASTRPSTGMSSRPQTGMSSRPPTGKSSRSQSARPE